MDSDGDLFTVEERVTWLSAVNKINFIYKFILIIV